MTSRDLPTYLVLTVATLALVVFHFHALVDHYAFETAWTGFLVGFGAGLALGLAIDRLVIRPGVDAYLRRHGRL